MYLHIGSETIVSEDSLIGIFDLDNTSVSKFTREFLRARQQEGTVVTVAEDIPKSFVLCAPSGRRAPARAGKPARRAQAQKTGVFPVLRNRREHLDLSVCAQPRAAAAPDGAPRGWSRCGRASETATRPNAPVLDIVPDSWEQYLVSNPAPIRGQDG